MKQQIVKIIILLLCDGILFIPATAAASDKAPAEVEIGMYMLRVPSGIFAPISLASMRI